MESHEERTELLRNQRLGRYELRGFIGRGGFGIVLKAHDVELDRDVALKIPRPEFVCHPQVVSRFLHEARAAASLRHPSILRVYDVGTFGTVPFIASDFSPGTDMGKWLSERVEPTRPGVAAKLLHVIADAVGYAHSQGVIHQDIKPANILLDTSSAATGNDGVASPQVTDFGLACHIRDGEGIQASHTGGTRQYMAPEQVRGDTAMIGTHTDVYALGLVLRDVLTLRSTGAEGLIETRSMGTAPTDSADFGRRHDPPRPRSVPEDLWAIYRRCVEPDPARRYRDGWELRDDLARFLDGRPVKARPVSAAGHLARVAKRHPATAALLGLLLLGVMTALPTFAYLYFRERDARFKAKSTKAAAREFVDASYEDLVENKTFDVPGMEEARRVQMGRVLKFYEALAREEPGDEMGLYDLQVAHHRTANLAFQMGQMEKVRDHRSRCLAIIDQLLLLDPKNKDYRFARFHNLLYQANETVPDTASWDAKERALKVILELERDYPEDADIEEAAMTACFNAAYIRELPRDSKTPSPCPLPRGGGEGTEIDSKRQPEAVQTHSPQRSAPQTGERGQMISGITLHPTRDEEVWTERLREAMQRLKRFEMRHGATESTRQKYATMLASNAAHLVEEGHYEQAAELYREACQVSDELSAARPESRILAAEAIGCKEAYAAFLGECGQHDEAKTIVRSVLGPSQKLVSDFPGFPAGHCQLIRAHLELGIIESRMSLHHEASLQFRKAMELLEDYLRQFPSDDFGRRVFEGYWCRCPDASIREEVMQLLRSEGP